MTLINEAKILINGAELPYSSDISVQYEDLHGDSTGRSINTGVLAIQRIRKDLCKIELRWTAISLADAKKVQEMLSTNVTFSVQFYSPLHGARVTRTMYSSNSTNEYVPTEIGMRMNLTRNLIEV